MVNKAEKKNYRHRVTAGALVSFQVRVKETDLLIHAETRLEEPAREAVLRCRGYLEAYIGLNPEFATTLSPWKTQGPVPPIVADMVSAGEAAGVGPMAAVAGAIAEQVGRELLESGRRVIVENGGDIFLKTDEPVVVGIYAGRSPLSMRIGLRIHPEGRAMAVCTSSGTVGHSVSFGNADAVCVIGASCALADAAATAIGNRISSKADIQQAMEFGKRIPGTEGLVVIVKDRIAMWGQLELVPLEGKKG
jgi:ApbE superfamily uncharacterized protein (UPF0280 family)